MQTNQLYRHVLARSETPDPSLLADHGTSDPDLSGPHLSAVPNSSLREEPGGLSVGNGEDGSTRTRVVVIGAGFGGLAVARRLADAPVEVTIIDRHNYHTFQPLLYQVATAGLEPGQIAHTVRGIFQAQKRVQFRLGTVVDVDADQRHVRMEDGRTVPYDYLIVAAGAVPQYYGIPGVREHSHALKSLADAANLRSHVLRQFERAAVDDFVDEEGGLRFVVVGGGPTGVEMAGALVELFDRVLADDFPEVDASDAEVVLVEMAESVLPPYDSAGRDYALKTLRDRGVEVRLGDAVERATDEAVYLQRGDVLSTQTLIWAAGVQASPLAEAIPSSQTDGGRVVVDEHLRVPAYETTYVIGDMAAATDAEGDPLPQLAPVAVQEGRYVARQIRRRLRGEPTEPFAYDDPGIMATIGRNAAVVETAGGFQVTGFVAWLMWTVLHIWELIGFRNRLSVMLDWIYSYFTHERSARLIFEAESDSTQVSEYTSFRS